MTLGPAPICESPGVTCPGRAGSPARRARSKTAPAAHLASGFSATKAREITSGGRASERTSSSHPLPTLPYPGGRTARAFSYRGGGTIWCSRPPCTPGVDSPAVVQCPPALRLNATSICSSHAPSCKRFQLILKLGKRKDDRRGGKKREAADSKRRIKVQLPFGSKSREGTSRGGGGLGAASWELRIKTSAESPGRRGDGGGGAGRVTSP